MALRRTRDDSKDRVKRLFAARKAAGLIELRAVWIPNTPESRRRMKRLARDLRIDFATRNKRPMPCPGDNKE